MYLYPVRGIPSGCEVDYIDLGRYGAKYDREIVLADKNDKSVVVSNLFHPMACLSQTLKNSKLEITTSLP